MIRAALPAACLIAAAVCFISPFSCGPSTCDPSSLTSCNTGEECDSTSKACVKRTSCSADSDCANGLACSAGSDKTCFVNCFALGSTTDLYCRAGYKCSATGICALPGTCDPSHGDGDCNSSPTCDAVTKACVAPIYCTGATDASCANGYACLQPLTGPYTCARSCKYDSDCVSPKTCTTSSNKCE